MSGDTPAAPIIVKRIKRGGGGHHGGAWKVAYADFVTAMMAFFLVMWIIGVGTREQKAAISQYFQNPSATPGTATVAPPGKDGPGGASDLMIDLGGAMDLSHGPGDDRHNGPPGAADTEERDETESVAASDIERAREEAREEDRKRLEELRDELHAAIENSQALAPFKDQLLLDITSEGLRIQIVDKQNRPMFDIGSVHIKDYTRLILGELAGFINRVPNRISITGHTDDAPYLSERGYSNWELSTDRANAARRALLIGAMEDEKVLRVVGLAATMPLDRADPSNPVNRRISIIVMTREAEEAALSRDLVAAPPEAAPAAADTAAPELQLPEPLSSPTGAPRVRASLPELPSLPQLKSPR